MRLTKSPGVIQECLRWMFGRLSRPQYLHLRMFVLGVLMCGTARLKTLAQVTAIGKHRTSLGLFLSRSDWDEQALLAEQALRILKSLKPRRGETVYLLIDDTRIVKRSRTMEDVSKLWDHSHQKFARGHMVVTVAIHFRGVTLPWQLRVWQPKNIAGRAYLKTTDIAAQLIEMFGPPGGLKVRVLFDAFYLCATVTKACNRRGFLWYSVASKNRRLFRDTGRSGSLKSLGPGILNYCGQRVRLKRDQGWRWMKIASTVGRLSKIGDLQIVFCKRPRDPWKNVLAIATNDLKHAARDIVATYEKRWNIEVLFKKLRSELGLGEYRLQKREGIRRHLHLVCLAHLTLTHHSLKSVGAQARQANSTIPLPKFQTRLLSFQNAVQSEHIKLFTRTIKDARTRSKIRQFMLTL